MIVNFMVDPEELKRINVPNPIMIKFTDISDIDFLGKTGKCMANAGFKFIVTKDLAEHLIKNKNAIEYIDNQETMAIGTKLLLQNVFLHWKNCSF